MVILVSKFGFISDSISCWFRLNREKILRVIGRRRKLVLAALRQFKMADQITPISTFNYTEPSCIRSHARQAGLSVVSLPKGVVVSRQNPLILAIFFPVTWCLFDLPRIDARGLSSYQSCTRTGTDARHSTTSARIWKCTYTHETGSPSPSSNN